MKRRPVLCALLHGSYLTRHPPCLIFQGMTKALVLLSCLMLAVSCGGQAGEASAASTRSVVASSSSDISSLPVPEDLGSRFAYVYGWRMAEALSQSGFSGDMSYVARGTADWLSGEALFSEEEMSQITEDFQREAFQFYEISRASAMSIIMFFIMLAVLLLAKVLLAAKRRLSNGR